MVSYRGTRKLIDHVTRFSLIWSMINKFIIWCFLRWGFLQSQRPRFDSWVEKICWRRDRLPTPVFLAFPYISAGKESTCNAGDYSSIPGLGRSAGEGIGYPTPYSGASLVAHLVKNLPVMQETWVRSLGLGRSPGEGQGYPLQYSGLENPMVHIVHWVTKSQTRLSDFLFFPSNLCDPRDHFCAFTSLAEHWFHCSILVMSTMVPLQVIRSFCSSFCLK